MKLPISLLFQLVCLLPLSQGLYEDQVGKWDWRRTLVGSVQSVISVHLSSSQSLLVATQSNVIASLSLRTGNIIWRQVLEDRHLTEPRAKEINLLQLSHPSDVYGLTEATGSLKVYSISGNGRYVRLWSLNGVLEEEKSLPDDFIHGISCPSRVAFHVDTSKSVLLALSLSEQDNVLTFSTFDLKHKSLKQLTSEDVKLTSSLKMRDCVFATDSTAVCVSPSDVSLKLVSFPNKVSSFPLKLFGLKSDSEEVVKNIRMKLLHRMPSASLILVNLHPDAQVVVKVSSETVSLVKIIPDAVDITVAPLSLPDGTTNLYEDEYAAFVLIRHPKHKRQMKIACFRLQDWSEATQHNEQFAVSESTSPNIRHFAVLPFLKDSKTLMKGYKILLTMDDDSLVVMSPRSGGSNWIREESLADILSTTFIDLPLSELESNIEQGFLGLSANSILKSFMARITSQIAQFQTLATTVSEELAKILTPVDSKTPNQHFTAYDGVSDKKLTRDYFGLHKIILILTKSGKILALDNLSSETLWAFFDEDFARALKSEQINGQVSAELLVQRTSSHYPYPAVCTIVTKSGFILSFDPVHGRVFEHKQLKQKVRQLMLLPHLTDQHLKGILILTADKEVVIYPETAYSTFEANAHKYFMMTADVNTGHLEGLSFSEVPSTKKTTVVWTAKIPVDLRSSNPMSVYFKRHAEHVHSLGRVLGDRNVMYRYLNPNVAVVVTERIEDGQGGLIDVYVIDAVTGRVIYSTNHKKCRGPVYVVHSENSVIYSYFNEKSRRTELSAFDLYEGLHQVNGTTFSSVDQSSWKPVVEHATFIVPTGIRALTDTVTEKGVTNKHLLVALSSGGLLELPKAFLDPRRPVIATMEHREEGLIPYIPELPIPSEGFFNYNQSVLRVKSIDVGPSGLESTCLVFAHGLDIFYSRVTPSKTFDILKDDFDHILITAVLVIMIVMAYVSKWLSAQKSLKAAWT